MTLIFLHIAKTGGSSLLHWLKVNNNDISYNPTNHMRGNELLDNIYNHQIVHLHVSEPLKRCLTQTQWDELRKSNAKFISIIRDPIKRLESYWNFQFQKKEQQSLPQVTQFNRDFRSNIYEQNPLVGYFEQPSNERLTIDECVEISWELQRSGSFNSLFSRAKDNEQYPYFNDTLKRWVNFRNHTLFPNYQYSQVFSNFGEEYIKSVNKHKDILLTTEQLSRHIKSLSATDQPLQSWLGKENFKKDRINETTGSYKEINKINAKNKYLFHIMNQDDYKLWASVYAFNQNQYG